MNQRAPLSYRDSGVNIDAGNELVHRIGPLASATKRAGVMGGIGGFGALFDPKAAGYADPVLVACTDGVGTKLKIAIETGSHDGIGVDLVAMSVNDLVVQGAEPLFFLDYFACGRLDVDIAARVVAGIARGCELAGCALIGGETAEMPGLYAPGDYDLAGFAVGAAERGKLLPRQDIAAGDMLIGLASSGVHSNGYSLVRRVVSDQGLEWGFPFAFDGSQSIGDVLLTPTRIYVRPLLDAIRETGAVKALAHITGGGITENLPRILPNDVAAEIELASWSPPPVFRWLAETGGIPRDEMLRTFNCGIGMVAVVAPSDAARVMELLAGSGEHPTEIGRLVSAGAAAQSVRYAGDPDFMP